MDFLYICRLKCPALKFKLKVQRERMSGEGKVVCVTGASGFIASWLVKLLLEHGYTVKATVRDPNDPHIKHLHTLDGAAERLHIFKANLMEEGSFDSAVDGCEGVFHTASPVLLSTNDPQAELIDPAVKGTLNVLRSCAKVQSGKRVVITSSTASVFFNERPLTPDVVADETWFSDPDFCKKSKSWYPLSKTLAEEAAWKFAKENEIDLVTLHPGFVIGPSLHSKLSLSLEVILNIINGVDTFPSPYRFVDVRDVAYAHIQALEVPTASSRYLLVGKVIQLCEVLKILHEHYPTLCLPEKFKDADCEPTYQISKDRIKSLGINFMPLEGHCRKLEGKRLPQFLKSSKRKIMKSISNELYPFLFNCRYEGHLNE